MSAGLGGGVERGMNPARWASEPRPSPTMPHDTRGSSADPAPPDGEGLLAQHLVTLVKLPRLNVFTLKVTAAKVRKGAEGVQTEKLLEDNAPLYLKVFKNVHTL